MIALSWSRISDYRQCPHKFRGKYIDKWSNMILKDEDKSPALVRGGNVHKQLEKVLVYKLMNMDLSKEVFLPEVTACVPLIDGLIANYSMRGELQVAVNDKFQQVSWYDKQAYFRVVYDMIGKCNDLLLGDWKTGRFTDYTGTMKELGQLHMAAVIGMQIYPEFDECSSVYLYVDHRRPIKCMVSKDDIPQMRDNLMAEHLAINEDKQFDPKKNKYCGYCDATTLQCSFKK